MSERKVFQYVQIKSIVNPDFWYKLAEIKLDVEKLEEKERKIYGIYTNFNAKNCLIDLDTSSFNNDFNSTKNFFPFHGILRNLNTIEAFKNCDKAEILKAEGERLINLIENGDCIDDPSLLSSFILLSYSDLKKYNFYYWFAFPASIDPVLYESMPSKMINEEISSELLEKFTQNYRNLDCRQATFFTATKDLEIKLLKESMKSNEDLSSFYFCFSDPSEFEYPGWMLRNFFLLLLKFTPSIRGKTIKIFSIRLNEKRELTPSRIFYVEMPSEFNIDKSSFKWTGWERNLQGKLLPKGISMGETMDPIKVAEHFSTLNLKLMKWRLLPNLNLDIIKRQKCLLFGAGTLGCAIARSLLSWGILNISFIDCGRVAYSNPVRQSLFTHSDAALNKFKATAAAERLKEILPSVNATGHVLQIPMPGHAVSSDSMREKVIENIHKIVDLIKEHEILFLLTDSRESRWLATMLGAYYGKTVITSALGFESYLVMRHGIRSNNNNNQDTEIAGLKCIAGNKLGCYFCNDVTAPGNSTRDRTLDQQCTVTRPGVSNIAASIAVELVVSLLQHEKKSAAPAYYQMKSNTSIPEGILGVLPHSIRGYLNTFSNILPATERFNQCIACSEKVLKEYETNGDEFLLKVFDSADYLENVTGISEMTDIDNDIIDVDFDVDNVEDSDE